MIHFDPERHEYAEDGQPLPSVSSILRDAGLVSSFSSPAIDRAMARGARVHRICEEIDLYGEALDDVDEEVKPYIDAFLGWREYSKGLEVVLCEAVVGGLRCGYAGKLDRVYRIGGKSVLVDIKTGKPSPWHRVQLAAYEMAALCSHPGVQIDEWAGLYLDGKGPAVLRFASLAEKADATERWAKATAEVLG